MSSVCPSMYNKMSDLMCLMQDPQFGVPAKLQKHFRTLVPAAFTGVDVIQWILNNVPMTDIVETQHLANLLCQHGYFFPVIESSLSVKEDSTLYRFQVPYFWPSYNCSPDNVEYAIYLTKRLMRNELKHGLEDYEADAYGKLRELLGHMWDFINTQAEMQLKIFKERKKVEKVILDSQERAYWRLHRPPPSTSFVFEERYGKGQNVLRKKTAKDYQQEIERYKFSLKTKPWLKANKNVEALVSWCEQFSEYDPHLSGINQQPLWNPGNPWITDDPILWALNTDIVDVPTERRVRRWGFSIQELVRDPIGRQVLETFLESEFSNENIRFWLAIQDLKFCPRAHVPEKVDAIYNEFLVAGAPCQVNIDSRTLAAVTKAMNDPAIPKRFCFSEAEEHVFVLMSKDSYPRFVRSEIYKSLLNAAQQQGTRKVGWRHFLFGAVGSKKISVPSSAATKLSTSSSSPSTIRAEVSSSPSGQVATIRVTSDSGQKKRLGKKSSSSSSIEHQASQNNLPAMAETSEKSSPSTPKESTSHLVTPWEQH